MERILYVVCCDFEIFRVQRLVAGRELYHSVFDQQVILDNQRRSIVWTTKQLPDY